MSAALSIQKLSKRFGTVQALGGVSLEVAKGEAFGFLGPNGAGKTTTIRIIMDYIRPDAGSVTILGLDAQKDSVVLKNKIGYLPSDRHLNEKWTGHDHINFVRDLKGSSALSEELSKTLRFDEKVKVKTLSTGNKQKLALILALMGEPELLILDEPTQGLDPILQNEMYEALEKFRASGGTVFMSSHNLPEVEKVCSRVAFIREGKVSGDETLQDIREKSGHLVTVTFRKPKEKLNLQREGVVVLAQTPTSLSLRVAGDLNPVIRELGGLEVTNLEVTHETLEEVLLEKYT